MQCVRDDQHCGYAGDAPLATLVAEACGGAPAAAIPPAADDATPFETSPIAP